MLRSLSLKNFRGFLDHKIEFCPETILIGQNNAGKTTAIEALRVLAVCQARAGTATFVGTPSWLDGFCQGAGYRPSLEKIDFDFANVQHAYDTSAPAEIMAKLRNNNEVHIYVGKDPGQVFCQLRVGPRGLVHSRSEMGKRSFGNTKVMPPIGSLLPHEKAIAKDRLSRYLDGYLSYRHFRNQLWERPADYRLFQTLLETTWYGIKIEHFENDHGEERNDFSLLVREGRFPSEVSWHGHGLQAWMQTIWFLARVAKDATIVLDEPDVYLHADLQRKLIKVIEGLSFKQAIIATHSSEIIGDVPFQNVTVIRKKDRLSKPANNAAQIQSALRGMGSLHSIQLSKIAHKGTILFVEGDDKAFLTDVAYKLGGQVFDSFSNIAVQEIKGKGNWVQVIGAAKTLSELSVDEIRTALLLDSDYMTDDQRCDFESKALIAKLALKIWNRKEIENYFIDPSVIARYVNVRTDKGLVAREDIDILISDQESRLENEIVLSFADVVQKEAVPRIEPKTAYRRAEKIVADRKRAGATLADLASGKDFIAGLSASCHKLYGVALTPLALCKEMRAEEMPLELRQFVLTLCNSSKLDVLTFAKAAASSK